MSGGSSRWAVTLSLLRLGSRLATGTRTGERFRPAAMIAVGALAAVVLLHTVATSNASARLNLSPTLLIPGLSSVRWVVQLGVALPVFGLVATAARLSALTRDRRIARLRVLGLSQGQTRLVAATETVMLLVVGIGLGALLYVCTRSSLAGVWLAAMEFPREAYRAGLAGWLTTLVGLPALTLAIACGPVSREASTALRADRTGVRPRAGWRVAVLLAGASAVAAVTARAHLGSLSRLDSWLYPIGAALTVAGVFLTVPLATRLIATVLLRLAPVPSVLIAGRRLQHLPPGAGRVVTATVSAVFVLALLQPLTEPFRDDPVLRADRVAATTGPQLLLVMLDRGADLPSAEPLLHASGITRAELATQLGSPSCGAGSGDCVTALVGTCWSLSVDRFIQQCRDDQAAWLDRSPATASPLQLTSLQGGVGTWTTPAPTAAMSTAMRPSSLEVGIDDIFLPVATPGLAEWLQQQPVQLVVEGPGGISVEQQLQATLRTVLPGAQVITTRAFANYVQARNIAMVLDAVTLAVLSIGLLAFLLASIDQVLGRRSSIISLLVLGVPSSTLRLAQLWESLTPLLIGLPFAGGLGFLTGSSFVSLSDAASAPDWQQLGAIVGVASVGALATALALLVLAVPPIDSALIRRS